MPCKLWEGALHLTGGVAGPCHNGLHTLFQLADIVRIRERGPSGKERREGGKEGRREEGRTKEGRREGGGKTDSTLLANTDNQ